MQYDKICSKIGSECQEMNLILGMVWQDLLYNWFRMNENDYIEHIYNLYQFFRRFCCNTHQNLLQNWFRMLLIKICSKIGSECLHNITFPLNALCSTTKSALILVQEDFLINFPAALSTTLTKLCSKIGSECLHIQFLSMHSAQNLLWNWFRRRSLNSTTIVDFFVKNWVWLSKG